MMFFGDATAYGARIRKLLSYPKRTCLANHKITRIFTRKYEEVRYKL